GVGKYVRGGPGTEPGEPEGREVEEDDQSGGRWPPRRGPSEQEQPDQTGSPGPGGEYVRLRPGGEYAQQSGRREQHRRVEQPRRGGAYGRAVDGHETVRGGL